MALFLECSRDTDVVAEDDASCLTKAVSSALGEGWAVE